MKDFDFICNIIDTNSKLIIAVNDNTNMFLLDNFDLPKVIYEFEPDEFDYLKKRLVDEISHREDPSDRVERWECFDNETFSDKKKTKLLNSRVKNKARPKKVLPLAALKELTNSVNLSDNMSKLLLSEIKLYSENDLKHDGNRLLKLRAEILRLL